MNDTIATNREYYNKLAEAVADQEVNEDQIAKDEDTVDAYHKSVQEAFRLCTLCNSMKNVHNAVQELEENIAKIESFYDAEPSKNYNANLKTLGRYQDTLMVALGASTMGKTHPLRLEASKTIDKMYQLQTKMTTKIPADVKPSLSSEDRGIGGLKFGTVSPPTFSGNQKYYQTFWSEFKAIHETAKLTGANKLGYLRQAQQDPELKRRISENIDNGDKYEDVIAKFRQHFDRPRQMHRIYVQQILQLSQVKPTRSSILDCASTVQSAMNGLKRLEQWDAPSIFTSIIENLLPTQLRAKWADDTISSKKCLP